MIQDTIKINAGVLNEEIATLGIVSSDIATLLTENGGIPTDEASVDNWRAGRANPSLEAAREICKWLQISFEKLTEGAISEGESFEDLLQRVIREEQDGTFPASHKNKGLLLPGLFKVMEDRGVGAQDLARSMGLDTRTVNRYMNGQRGVPIERALQITHLLDCLPSSLTTYEHLAAYHSPDNSRSNRTLVTNPQPQPVAGASSSKKQSQTNTSGNGRADKKIADLEAQIRDLTERNSELNGYVEELHSIEKDFQSMEAALEGMEDRISSLEEEFESVKAKKNQSFFSRIFG